MGSKTLNYKVKIEGEISDLEKKFDALRKKSEISVATKDNKELDRYFASYEKQLNNLKQKASLPINSSRGFDSLEKDVLKLKNSGEELDRIFRQIGKTISATPEDFWAKEELDTIKKLTNAIKNYDKVLKDARENDEKIGKINEKIDKKNTGISDARRKRDELQRKKDSLKDPRTLTKEQIKTKETKRDDLSKQNTQLRERLKLLQEEEEILKNRRKKDIDEKGLSPQAAKLENYKSKKRTGPAAGMNLKEIQEEQKSIKNTINDTAKEIANIDLELKPPGTDKYLRELKKYDDGIQESSDKIKNYEADINELNKQKLSLNIDTKGAAQDLLKAVKATGALGDKFDETNITIEHAQEILEEYAKTATGSVLLGLNQLSDELKDIEEQTNKTSGAVSANRQEFERENEAAGQLDGIKSRIQQFVGLQGAVEIARNAMRNAITTIRELDDTMTEMAVVTEHGLGHYWDQLPEHTKRANELGVAINDVYKAETLYYQQGLKTNQVTGMSVETLKMARISGMEAADATNKMTAAIRGFNMELNETSAKRVNDVYSELAAITAADTQEIANAMTKTASIASNAGMEFETTSAFLSQIIETTRESAETAGTAMKTIIARFQELKKAPEEIGEVDGEIVDANKIESALRSVGVALRDGSGQFRELDDVFLELSSKWSGLDKNTQRYIATMAAGSRQQSRFIAMMSDYGRTMELVDAANNSAGASQEQFEKTLESLSSKITKLKNSWDTFTTTIFDNKLIGGVIDAATKILDTLNEIISKAPDAVQPFLSIGMIMGGMKLGQKAVNSVLGSAGESLGLKNKEDKESKIFGKKAIFSDEADKDGNKVYKGSDKDGLVTHKEIRVQEIRIEVIGEEKSEKIIRNINRQQYDLLEKKKEELQLTQSQTEAEKKQLQQIKQKQNALRKEGMADKPVNKNWKDKVIPEQRMKELQKRKDEEKKKITPKKGVVKMSKDQKIALDNLIKEEKLTKDQINLLGKKRLARLADAAATGNQIKVEKELKWLTTTQNNLQQGGIKGLLTEIGLRMTGNTVKTTEIGITKGLISAKLAEAAAWIKANSAMLIGLGTILLIVAGITLLVGGIMKISKAWKEAGKVEENKLKQLNKSLDEMKNAAQEAKQQLDSIAQNREGLEQLQEKFDDLTKGTKEWRQALMEINNEVLELLEKYPDLGKYISRGKNGEMQITDEGWNHIYDEQQKAYSSAMSGQIATQMQISEVQSQMSFDKHQTREFRRDKQLQAYWASDEAKKGEVMMDAGAGAATGAAVGTVVGGPLGAAIGGLIGAGVGALAGLFIGKSRDDKTAEDIEREHTGGLTSEEFQNMAARMAEAGLDSWDSKDVLKAEYEKMGYTADFENVYKVIDGLGTEFDKMATEAQNFNIKQRALADSYAQNIVAQNEYISNSEYGARAAAAVASSFGNISDQIGNRVEEIKNDKEYVNKDGKATNKLIQEYAELTGKTTDEVNALIADSALSVETMATTLADTEINKKMNEAMLKTTKELERLALKSEQTGKSLEHIINATSQDGSMLTQVDINTMKEALGVTDFKEWEDLSDAELDTRINDYLKNENTSLEKLGMSGRSWLENYIKADESFADARQVFKSFGLDFGILENQMAGVADKFSTKLQENALKMTSEGNVKEVASLTEGIMEGLTEEEQTQFMSILSEVDWSSKDAIAGLSEELDNLGIVSNDNIDKIQALENAIMDLADTKFDVSIEDAFSMSDFIQKIEEAGGKAAEFTKEELDRLTKMINVPISEFTQVGSDAWRYQGGNQELVGMLKDEQDLLIEGAERDLQNIVDLEKKYEDSYDTYMYEVSSSKFNNIMYKSLYNVYENSQTLEEFNQKRKAMGLSEMTPEKYMNFVSNDMSKHGYSSHEERMHRMFKKDLDYLQANPDAINTLYDLNGNYISNYRTEDGYYVDPTGMKELTTEEIFDTLIAGGVIQDTAEKVIKDKAIRMSGSSIEEFFNKFATESQKAAVAGLTGAEQIDKMKEIINEEFSSINLETMKEDFKAQEDDIKTYWKTLSDSQEIINSFADQKLFSDDIAKWKEESFAEIIEQENLEYTLNAVTNSLEGLEKAAEYTASALTKMFADDTKKFSNMVAKLEDVSEILNKDNRDALEYTTAFSEVANMINAFFGSSLGTDFFGTEDMQEAVEKFVSGNEEGWKAIQDEAAKKGWAELEGRGMSAEDIKKIQTALSNVEEGKVFKYDDLGIDAEDEKYIDAINQILGAQGFSTVSDNTERTLSVIKYDTSALEKLDENNDDDSWQNPWDWLYNKNNEINQLIREREKLERSYQKILEDENSSVEDVLKNRAERIGKLNEQLIEERDKQSTAREQKNQVQAQIDELDFSKYMEINDKGVMEINHRLIEQDADAGKISAEDGAILEALEAEWDEAHQAEQDAIDTQEEIEDEVKEIKEEGRDELSDLYDQVKEGLIMSYQEEIDALSEINDTIADSQSKMLDKIQEQIDEQRQARENEKTEQNLEDKRQKLNYLRMDTSGANAVEIAKLEKELGEEEQNYQDSLVDQQLQKLQADNEKAKEQRDRQIQLMNDQLQAYSESQIVWEDVQKILTNAWKSGEGFMTTPAGEFVGMANSIKEMNPIELEDFYKENAITNKMAEAYALQEELTSPESSDKRTNLATLKGNIKTLEDTLTTKLVGKEDTNLNDAVHSVEQAIKKAKDDDNDYSSGLGGSISDSKLNLNGIKFTEAGNKYLNETLNALKQGKGAAVVASWVNSILNNESDVEVELAKSNMIDMFGLETDEDAEKLAKALEKNYDKTEGRYTFSGVNKGSFLSSTDNNNGNDGNNDNSNEQHNFYPQEIIYGDPFWFIKDNVQERDKELADKLFREYVGADADSSFQFNLVKKYAERDGWDIQEEQALLELKNLASEQNLSIYEYFTQGLTHDQKITKAATDSNFGKIGGLKLKDGASIKIATQGNGFIGFNQINSDTNFTAYSKGKLAPGNDEHIKVDEVTYHPGLNKILAFIRSADGSISGWTYWDELEQNYSRWTAYATGGLADFTGPAWLDGTKSRPELVLNQQDTQNFIALKDILADVMDSTKGTTTNSTTNGDNYYEIEINVEGINNDYDVEQIADKIKSMIQNDAMYRNVNALQKTSK